MTKLKDITPPEHRCAVAASCPAVFRTESGDYQIRGKLVDLNGAEMAERHPGNEATVVISKEIIEGAILGDALAPISNLTLGDDLASKITESEAVALVNQVLSAKRQIAAGVSNV